jgi:hypothetical protein
MTLAGFASDESTMASTIMYELLGRRWVWPYITTTEVIEIEPGQNYIYLSGRPVTSILSITTNVDSYTQLKHTLTNNHRVRLYFPYAIAEGPWAFPFPFYPPATIPRSIITTYTYGSVPPDAVLFAIQILSDELDLLIQGSDQCRLPERVKTVVRQGVSLDIVSPLDFLDKGRTGITQVDQVLSTFNFSKARRPARVISGVIAPPRRFNTTQGTTCEVQSITLGGGITGGTYTLTCLDETTVPILYNATQAAVQAALINLSSVGNNNVAVLGPMGGPYTVTFVSDLGAQAIAVMTANTSGLIGTEPTVTVEEVTMGSSG